MLGEKFREWLLHLPKTLWELGSSNLPATEVFAAYCPLGKPLISLSIVQTILRVLLRLVQRRSIFLTAEVCLCS